MTEIAIRPDDADDSAARSRHPDAAAHGRPVRPALRHLLVPTVAAIAVGLAGLGAFVGAAPSTVAAATSAAAAPLNLADLAARVSPAVVTISSAHDVAGAGEMMPEFPFDFPPGSPFEDFFRHFREQQRHGGRGDRVMALGSGFIVDPSGYIVTNNHVVDEATDIKVTLSNGSEYPAKLVGTDAKTDIAVLKIKASTPLPAVAFGDSDKMRVGDWVMAVGNPFGLGGTVTAGIISARGRDLQAGPFDDFLQIDAAINQGNSGGPTFNLDGQVVGINTAIASPNGGSVGIGFDIPSNLAQPVVAQLESHGSVERGWLGVAIQPVTPEIAAAVGLDKARGALVTQVEPNSPAAKAKLRQGDVILGYNGRPVSELRDLTHLVADTPAGKTAELEVWRDRTKVSTKVEIAKPLPERQAAAGERSQSDEEGTAIAPLGATLAAITPEARQEMDIPGGVDGVVITDVDNDGSAAAQGLRRGDVIEQIGQQQVRTPEDVGALVAAAIEARQDAVLLLVNRAGSEVFVAVKVGQA
ncbi:MAG: DegQ family serine endoprotease [Dongiaceae bacterium]